MPNARIQKYEVFTRGTNLAVEPERLRPVEFKRAINIDIARDGLPETSDGYAVEFEVPKRRQIATMEDSEDSEWAGNAVDELATANFGFQSRKHAHTASDSAKTSTWTPPSDFLDFIKTEFQDNETTAGDVKFKLAFRSTDVSEILTIEVRFRKDATNYFSESVFPPSTDNAWEITTAAFTDWTTVGSLTWDEIVDVQIITTPIASNLAHDVMFDDFFIEDLTQSEPITGLHSFEIPITATRFLMVATSDMIYSVVGTTLTKRAARLGRQRPVHFATANDYVFEVNDNDIPKRWDPNEASFRDAGVPAPPSGMTGAGIDASAPDGDVIGGDYSAKVTFDMGPHGEGNPSPQTNTFTVVGPSDAIQYDSIPLGPPGTVRRIIYRSAVGTLNAANGPWFLDLVIADNTTTAAGANTISRASNTIVLASAQVQTDGAQPPVLKYIAEANSTLFGVPSTRPSRIRHSDVTRQPNRTIEQWDSLNELDVDPDDGDIITGLLKHKEFLYPFKRLSTFLVNPTQLVPQKISAIYGSISQRVMHDAGEKAYFWSARFGPMKLVGNRITEIGKQLNDLEGRPLGVTGVNENVLVPVSKIADRKHEITSIADWQLGTLTKMTATEVVGSIEHTRSPGSDTSVDFARSVSGATISQSLTANAVNLASAGVSSVIDGVTTLGAGPLYGKNTSAVTSQRVILSISLTQKIYNRAVLHVSSILEELFGNLKVEAVGPAGTTTIANYTTWGSLPIGTAGTSGGLQFIKQGAIGINFPARAVSKFIVTFDTATISTASLFLGVSEFQVFRQAFERNAQWESPDIDLVSTSVQSWGIFLANLDLNGGSVTFQMKSGASLGALASALYQDISPNAIPDSSKITPAQFVKFRILSQANVETSPRIHDITITFIALETEILGTLVESNGIFFEDKSWFNLVQRNTDIPSTLWKVGYFEESMEHNDYRMSCWAIHDGALMSGSAIDGKVFRHIRDQNGIRLPNKDGRPMVTEMEPANNALGEQAIEKSVRDYLFVARNESESFKNILGNPDFEQVVGPSDPVGILTSQAASWDQNASNPTKTARLVSTETDSINVFSRKISMSLDARLTQAFEAFFAQSVPLTNDTDYVLKFFSKNLGPPPDLKITTADGLILGADGTWLTTNTAITIADTAGVYAAQQFAFRTLTDIENRGPVEFRFLYPNTVVVLQGITFFDLMSLKRVQTRDRKVEIMPVVDGVDILPAKIVDLVADRDGIVKARGRIDRAGVRNVTYRIRTDGVDSGFKFLGLLTSFAAENVRSGG